MLIFPNFPTMANRMQAMDSDLKECYNHDLDWTLLPEKLRQVRHKIPFCFASHIFYKNKGYCNNLFLPTPNYQHVLAQFLSLSFVDLSFIRKGMKQRETTVLLGILTLISFCMGHAALQINEFWTEPIIVWIAVVLPTGMWRPFNITVRSARIQQTLNTDNSSQKKWTISHFRMQ